MSRRAVLLDTSFVVALTNKKDRHHDAAKRIDIELMRAGTLSILHRGILLEIGDGFARIERRALGIHLLQRFESEERYGVVPISDELWREAMATFRARSDKEWGLTDCSSFALMRQEGITEALTADVHFRQAGFKALLLDTP